MREVTGPSSNTNNSVHLQDLKVSEEVVNDDDTLLKPIASPASLDPSDLESDISVGWSGDDE
jgi:hypothetical protein